MEVKTDYPQLAALLELLKRRLAENDIQLKSLSAYCPSATRDLNGLLNGDRQPTVHNLAGISTALWKLVQDPTQAGLPKKQVEAMRKSFVADLRRFAPDENASVQDAESLKAVFYKVAGLSAPVALTLSRAPTVSCQTAPPLPSLVIGREEALRDLKARLGIPGADRSTVQVLTAVRGWPGVGKTTVAAALAHDRDIATVFPDGVLWTSLGQKPDILSELATWGRALGTDDLIRCRNLRDATTRLAGLLRIKQMLLIVDDAWEAEHVVPFKAGGPGCAMLVTTRVTSVARALAPTPKHIYLLGVLSEKSALELLTLLAPSAVKQQPEESSVLVQELEGLPLAIQVAGRLLHAEASYGFGVHDLLAELRKGAKLLKTQVPAELFDLVGETIPTVAALLQKSTDRLDPQTRERFAYLGAFAPKPATFDLGAMKAVWKIRDPKPTVRVLVDRGLLDPVGESGRFQMHALLVLLARSLWSRD